MRKTFAIALILLCSLAANALPLVWRADWPDSKPVETLVHRGTDIELQPMWFINKEPADTNGWTFTTFCQTNAVGPWFGPLPGAFFSHTNDVGAAFYNVMVRASAPGGAVNYTAFARLRMLDSPGYTPGELPLPVSTIDFSKVVAINAPWLLPAATNDIGTIKVELGSLSNSVSTLSAAVATNSADIATLKDTTATNSAAIADINSKIPSAASASNQLADKEWIDDEIDTYAAYYITYTAAGAAFPTRAALLNATVVYSGGVARTPTRNDYAVVLADESHGGAEWRYIYTVAAGATSGQWDAQYPIETNDYDALANKPQINGVSLSGNKTGADLGVLDLAGGTMTPTFAAPTILSGQVVFGADAGGPYIGMAYGQNTAFLRPNSVRLNNRDAALAALNPTAGNLAALDADGNPTDSLIPAANVATKSMIDASNTTFSNAVLSVGLGIDTNTVAVINELVDSAHDLPVTGATSVGALLLALAAAVAALKRDKADASALPYAISEAIPLTVTSGAAAMTLADRTHNVRTVAAPGTGNTTTITATLPPIIAGKSRDMFLNLTVGSAASDTGDISLSIVEPSGATAQIEIGSVEDIGVGKNEILITENALSTTSGNVTTTHWLVTVRHEDFAS